MSTNSLQENFINNLKKIMKENNQTQTDIAKITGVSQSAVSDWLTGKKHPRISNMQKIISYFNISLSSLISENASPINKISRPSSDSPSNKKNISIVKKRKSEKILCIGRLAKNLPDDDLDLIIHYTKLLLNQKK